MEVAFELAVSDERRIEEAAMIIRRNIVECQSSSDNVPFPPTTSWLLSEERQPPNLLRDFLSHVVSGKSHTHLSENHNDSLVPVHRTFVMLLLMDNG